MLQTVAICLLSPVASQNPFPHQTAEAAAETARWVIANGNWAYLTTLSDGAPEAQVVSFSDGAETPTGRLFFYLMGSATAKRVPASLTISQAALNHTTGCEAAKTDPEDPRCAKLTVTGILAEASGAAAVLGKTALFARHPAMKEWPVSHGFTVFELAVTDLWMIDFYGGAAGLTPKLYYAATPKHNVPSWPPAGLWHRIASSPPMDSRRRIAAATARTFCDEVAANAGCCPACGYKWAGGVCTSRSPPATPYCELLAEPRHAGCCVFCGHVWSVAEGKCVAKKGEGPTAASAAASAASAPPAWNETASRARWLVYHSLWASIGTVSVHLKGRPWGNVRSVADGVGANSTGPRSR